MKCGEWCLWHVKGQDFDDCLRLRWCDKHGRVISLARLVTYGSGMAIWTALDLSDPHVEAMALELMDRVEVAA